jgi:AcrR family transcriptional regulator
MDSVHIALMMPGESDRPASRSAYRHGDLRNALLEAGIELAREGGAAAVVLREATRRAGVVPNAAYRHFASRDDLLAAVRDAAVARVALAMERELAGLGAPKPSAQHARATLRAVGTGYLRFARDEPGLFQAAFARRFDPSAPARPAAAGQSGLGPFGLLCSALDRLVAAGALPPERRPGAEFLAWSAVHGMAMLTIEGPLSAVPDSLLDTLGQRLLDMVERGL